MEAPSPPPPTAPPLSSAVPAPTLPTHLNYPDSVDSSPRSRNTDSWDDPFPPAAASTKLRLMCSYGGHIVPRPHDKSLCYVGGDTRIVVVDRNTSLSDLSSRLSKTFLNGRPFTLKYQLPSEDLDSLISVTTDEDFDNMIDEYDRTASNSAVKPSRIRLFLFPTKPDSSQSIGPILDNSAKSEDWFLNALNGAGLLNRGFSESASVNCLLGLDEESGGGNNLDSNSRENEVVQQSGSFGNCKNVKQGQDVHSVPDSPMLETTSSFGSTSSSPSLANLPPIRVHVVEDGGGSVRMQDHKVVVGIEEQFSQMGIGGGGVVQKQQQQDEGFVVLSSPPPMPAVVTAAPISSGVVAGEYQNRVFSDDERSDHGVPVGYRKPPTPQPQTQPQPQPQSLPPQFQQKSNAIVDLPSPDSVSSDNSISNPLSRPKPVIYQEQVQIPTVTTRVPSNPIDPKLNMSDPHTRIQIQQQVQDPGYVLQPQFDQQQPQPPQQQQQYLHNTHFIHHTPAGAVPMPQYYPVYPSQQQSHHPQHHPQMDQQYLYYMPARQAYNIGDATGATVPSSRPQTQPNPPSAAYNPIRNVPMPKSEMTAGAYRAANAGAPQIVQVPSTQHQQQFVAYTQIHHPSQTVAPPNSAAPASYAYDYVDPAHAQVYYTQPMAPMPSQYQTMAAPAGVIPEASSQIPSDSIKQQIRTSQPI
ncbi:RNA polymerase II degradation factor 1 [Senna tora]|uniref:RNA polymerase II degradation factor 1 n=1 Tax=Senna tora TaxID=362788 RepID=A0A834TWP4_9FABA|nr:RNA polymerase II degradation factor 1 [Senna tora]